MPVCKASVNFTLFDSIDNALLFKLAANVVIRLTGAETG